MASSAPPELKKAPNAPQRLKSAFFLFSAAKHKAIMEDLAKEGKTKKTSDIAKLVSEAWHEIDAKEKEDWEKKARKSLDKKGLCKTKRTPKDPNAPKRPMSAYLAFSNTRRAKLKREHQDATNGDLSKMLSVSWKEAPVELRKKYMDEATGLRATYKAEMAQWRQTMDAALPKKALGRPPKRQRPGSDGCAVAAVVGSDPDPNHRVDLVKDPQDHSTSTRTTRSATARANATRPTKTNSVMQAGVFPDGKYVEEIAYHVFAGMNYFSDADLQTLDPLPPRSEENPEFPANSDIQWTRSDQILYADLTDVKGNSPVSMESRRLYAKLLDRDDTALVTLGVRVLDGDKVGAVLKEAFPYSPPTHLFRHYCRKHNNSTCNDEDGSITHLHHTRQQEHQQQQEQQDSVRMRTGDFWNYLMATEHTSQSGAGETPSRTFFAATNANGEAIQIDPRVDRVAMVDISIPKFMWRLNHPHVPTKLAEEMLPGGQWCFTNHIPHIRRPFLGPYMDISPGGGDHTGLALYSQGTLDLALSVICGFYEIVLLRRLPEVHALNARRIGQEVNGSTRWPTHATIDAFQKMGYCPKVFLVKAGQQVHIPKGCLYMIRKTSSEELPEHDCHFELRKELELDRNPVCISISYGWLFLGSDACGINRQLAATIEYATVRGQDGRFAKSLGVPETCVLKLVSEYPWNDSTWAVFHPSSPCLQEIARGILPCLRYIVERETKDAAALELKEPHSFARGSTIEPHGNDYFCRICNRELPNLFFHCTGCEVLLGKDFDICADCHTDEKYRCYHTMNQNTDHRTSNLQHTGDFDLDAAFDTCGCNLGQPCTRCFVDVDGKEVSRCKKCSCICHQQFTAQLRFFRPEQLEKLVDDFEHFAQGEVPFAEETLARLKREPWGLHLSHNASSVVEI